MVTPRENNPTTGDVVDPDQDPEDIEDLDLEDDSMEDEDEETD